MQFLNPEVFYFTFLLVIPLIVHLFQLQKFVKTPFTNVAFLQKIIQENRKSSKIKKWLLLAIRTLALLSLLFAFSQPYFSDKESDYKTYYSIYLDNSYSTSATGPYGNLLNTAKQELIENAPKEAKFSLITNDEIYKNISYYTLKNKLISLNYSSKQLDFNTIINEFKNTKTKESKTSHKNILISDFQNIKLPLFTNVTGDFTTVLLQPSTTNNISIDSVFTKSINTNEIRISATISNQGVQKNNVPIALYNNNKLLSKKTINLEEDQVNTVDFSLPYSNSIDGILKITFNDTFVFDNTFYFNISTTKKINVLSIGKASNYLNKIYTKDEFNFNQTNVNRLDYNSIQKQDLIILNEINVLPEILTNSLLDYVKENGTLVLIPTENSITSYNFFIKKLSLNKYYNSFRKQLNKITSIQFSHPLLKNVFSKEVKNYQYPSVNGYYSTRNSNASAILKLENGNTFLSQLNTNYAKTYVFTSPLSKGNSNFLNSPLIVPVFYNFAKQSFQGSSLYYYLHQNTTIDIPAKINKDDVLTLNQNTESLIPLQQTFQNKVRINTSIIPNKKGFYEVIQQKDTLKTLAFNIHKKESQLNFMSLKEINASDNFSNSYVSVKDLFIDINKKNEVIWLWKWFLCLAIVSLFLEIFILKYFKS